MKDISELKDEWKGEDCFIIGNGPSLRNFDLSKILDRNVIVSNCFHEHKLWSKFQNIFHVELNGALWTSQNISRWKINKLLLNPNVRYILRERFKDLYLKTKLPKDRIYFLRLIRRKLEDYSWDISKGSVWANSGVIEGSVATAQYLGCNTLYLMGCDATPYIDENGIATNAYFYDWSKLPYVYWPRPHDNRDYLRMLESWKVISKLFKERGIRVYNLSTEGNLKMFEFKRFEDVI